MRRSRSSSRPARLPSRNNRTPSPPFLRCALRSASLFYAQKAGRESSPPACHCLCCFSLFAQALQSDLAVLLRRIVDRLHHVRRDDRVVYVRRQLLAGPDALHKRVLEVFGGLPGRIPRFQPVWRRNPVLGPHRSLRSSCRVSVGERWVGNRLEREKQ